ncbi:HAMP domain-containing histidine kinase [Paenibacillus sp. 481]|nr:HAMP domain-containing histidine kinase [Paenibacillus sp. 481]
MIQSIIAHEIKDLFYIMSACLMFLIITPKFMYNHNRRKILFVLILIVLTFCYIGYEEINPFVYAVYTTPVCLALAALFEGVIPGIFTWLAFNICGVLFVQNDFLPSFVGSTILLAIGCFFHYRQLMQSTYWRISLLAITMLTSYLIPFLFLFNKWDDVTSVEMIIAIVGSYLSSIFVSYLYYHVKNQERLSEELYRAEKYQVIGQFAASISHEIRNPLTTAHGFLQLMRRENLTPEQMEKYRSYAIEGINQANAIITDYLNYAKPTVERPKPLNIQCEIDSVMPMITSLCVLSQIELDIQHLSKQPMYVMGESKKFQQCLLNIMKNAIEAMANGGHLNVTTWSDKEGVHIHVKDTGVGMSDYQIRRIGMPFYTTKEKGTGLGLMVVMSLVQAMHGKISYYSRPNEGTTCVLLFKPLKM